MGKFYDPVLPMRPIEHGALYPSPETTSPLAMASFGIIVQTFKGGVPSISVITYVATSGSLLKLLAQFGGYLTIIGLVWGCVFPRKYPLSRVAVTYDERTLLGHRSH